MTETRTVTVMYKGFRIEVLVSFIEEREFEVCYQHPLTGQWYEHLDNVFGGWSVTNEEDKEKWEVLREKLKKIDFTSEKYYPLEDEAFLDLEYVED